MARPNATQNCRTVRRFGAASDSAQQQRRQRQGREFRQPGPRHRDPSRRRRANHQQRDHEPQRDQRVVGVRTQDIERERVGGPEVGQHRSQGRPADHPAEHEEPQDRQHVEGDRRRVRRRQAVPEPAPAEDQVERHIGVVVDRPVRVSGGVAVRPVSVQRRVGEHLVGADHAGVADVDHIRVGDVQANPETDQEDHTDRQPPGRDQDPQRLPRPAASERQQQHSDHQVAHERIHQRHRQSKVRLVEERQRNREAQEHQQVEVQQGRTPAPGQERQHEQEAHRQPDVERVDVAPERSRISAGHRPRHLVAGPHLRHLRGGVVDVDLDHLGLDVSRRREPAHLPDARPARVDVRDPVRMPLSAR